MTNDTDTATTDLSAFRRDAAEHLDRLEQSGGVEVLTVDGQPKGVVMAPHVYDVMADKIRRAETLASIREGLAAAAAGRVRPARQAILELAAEHGLNLDDDDAGE